MTQNPREFPQLTDQQCDAFRSMPVTFRDMLRAAWADGYARMEAECDALKVKLKESDGAFNDQTTELETAVQVLEGIHPDCAMEYRYRQYPTLFVRPDGFAMPSAFALAARVEALRHALMELKDHAIAHDDGWMKHRIDTEIQFTPAASLAAYDERVKRATVEAIIAADDSDALTCYRRPTRDDYYRVVGIEPKEPKP